jgi:rod shape-determining protein MreC
MPLLPFWGRWLKNKSSWYLLVFGVLSLALLVLPRHIKSASGSLLWQVFYSPFYQAGDRLRDLYQVHLENQKLRKEISSLRIENGILEEQRLENHRLRQLLELKATLDFEVIPAEVISRDADFPFSTVVINSGTQAGVTKDLPAIDPSGLVGKVIEAYLNHATLQLLFDPGFRISAVIQRTRIVGIVSWKQAELLEMNFIPFDADVQVGDQVVTSGLSAIYPPGLRIGKVVKVSQKPESLFKLIEIIPFADVQNLEELFVIKVYRE